MGLDNEEVLSRFYKSSEFILKENKQVNVNYDFNELKGELNFDLINAENNETFFLKVIDSPIDIIESLKRKKLKIYLVPDECYLWKIYCKRYLQQ